ncbi:MAG: transporter, partial [Myxococcales bacterium]|nr:transporter [Myxococcales bacterium]
MISVRRRVLLLMAVLVAAGSAPTAFAQDAPNGFDIQLFNPMPSQQFNFLGSSAARVMPGGSYEGGFILNYAKDPLVVRSQDDDRIANLVEYNLTANLLLSFGIADRLEVGLDVPITIAQDGDRSTSLDPYEIQGNAGPGDVRLIPKLLLYSMATENDPTGLGLVFLADIYMQVGDAAEYQGEGLRVRPRLAVDWAFANGTRVGLNLGYMARPENQILNVEINDLVTLGVAADVVLTEDWHLVPEIETRFGVGIDSLDSEELPSEALLAVRYFTPVSGLMAELGAGTGIVAGVGVPDYRIFGGLTYARIPVGDTDGDGLKDDVDACPADPEDADDFDDSDGCPDLDNDQDGVLDSEDVCMNDPEDVDAFEDTDGCPDPDNDGEGIPDAQDSCPDESEDFDGFQDTDGCPDPDNDGDGFLDTVDQCPMEAENLNNFEDTDGCPDEEPSVVVVPCVSLQLPDNVYYDTGSDV